jgi:hypothetical protein
MFVKEIVHICATNYLFYVDLMTIEYSKLFINTVVKVLNILILIHNNW